MSVSNSKIILVGNRCIKNKQIRTVAEAFKSTHEICFSDTGIEYAGSNEGEDITMVYDDFTDEIFNRLNSRDCHIVSPTILIKAASATPPVLVYNKRPLYNQSMADVIVCFTGFNDRTQISRLASLVHYMGGVIRKEFSPKVTHLVANHCRGSKYRAAATLGRPVMLHDWVHQLWERRDSPEVTANSPEMMQYRAPPFLHCGLAFHGFSESDFKEMEEVAMANGGQLCTIDDENCTHIVVDNTNTLPDNIRSSVHIVKADWFWSCVQMEICADEHLYLATVEGRENTPSRPSRLTSTRRFTSSGGKKRKRHMRENLASLASEGELLNMSSRASGGFKSRRSSIDQLSVSTDSCDVTPNTSELLLDSPLNLQPKKLKSPTPEKSQPVKQSARQMVVGELLTTEINYCSILTNVLLIFRDGAENPDQPGGAILSHTDGKIIFGKIPAILDVHKEIRDALDALLSKWTEDARVAEIILSRVEKLRQAYPPFVNYIEQTKEKIADCMKKSHRYHAFMKVCERRQECGRQSLPDLLMNIVQRLPRVELLLQQIHKYTDKKCSDYSDLELAQAQLKSVMTHINEDKRLTDERRVLFDIMNDIDNCPPNLLSASRNFIARLDVLDVTGDLLDRGEPVTLFLFSDSLELVKKRFRVNTTPFKSPAGKPVMNKSKPFKHLEFLTLQSIKRVLDIVNDDAGFAVNSTSIFSILSRQVTDTRERLYTFQIPDTDDTDKMEFITVLAKTIANSTCRTDYETLITTQPASQFMITPLDTGSTGGKSITRSVSKFGRRLSRKMTMKSSLSSPLKRAMSTIIAPSRKSSLRHNDSTASSTVSPAGSVWELDQTDLDASPLTTHNSSNQLVATLPRNRHAKQKTLESIRSTLNLATPPGFDFH